MVVGGVVVGLRWPVMTLDALVAEAGEALGRARSLFGPAAFGVGFASTPALQGAGAQVASGVGESHGVWQGGAGSGYRRDANWTVQALDTTVAADRHITPALTHSGQAAATGARSMDNLIAETRSGVAAIAPSTGSTAGKQELATYVQGQLNRAKALLQTAQQQSAELAPAIRTGSAHYRAAAAAVAGTHGSPRLGVQAVDFKQDPPPPAPPLPTPRPQTGEPIKLPWPTTPGPVTVITANVDPNGPDDPQKHRCGPAEIGKDTTIAVGGALGIATGIAGEIPTLGAATAAIVAGAGALWDGWDKLGECK